MIRLLWVRKNRYLTDKRRSFLENFHPFSGDGRIKIGETGDISGRPRVAGDKATADRIGNLGEHDRNFLCERLQHPDQWGATRNDGVYRHTNKLERVSAHPIGCSGGPTNVD